MIDKKGKKILIVFGTRPEAIKFGPLIDLLKQDARCDLKICVTGQHRQMLDQVLHLFDITPDFDLNLMKPNQDLTDITCNVLLGMRDVLKEWRPDWVLVQGDTTTTFGASLAAFYQKIPVGHVEAGLRTGDPHFPWPEEINRTMTSSLASIHFAPTIWAKNNLVQEGISKDAIHVTGNTVIDALLMVTGKIQSDTELKNQLEEQFAFLNPEKKLLLITGHRRENFGEGFENICQAIKEQGKRPDVQIVYPVHLNPNVQNPVKKILGDANNVVLIEPLDYLPFVYLMTRSYMILTDSGGVQEEAPSLGKPVLVMRDTTERPEGVETGTVKLVGPHRDAIVAESNRLLDNPDIYKEMSLTHNPYGDGKASGRIVEELLRE
ncbi:MAG: UDP-N-acetylglucosamine 2-epimerase (non-hydrolyzing) [Candidatus Nitrohelix vancouverensis]|uniref:UDP-N-acetylglucosamine 2-epimerase (non-hydrolyzing) n=1 Tax=Candidatus Nitrohelix vancouverensis TaxID=2705534 RepID=A0A7T0C2F3_9BACT|nr:MAG: UDP-N-acetylglucosamine 2-epimerase (non-hydrolyzing) [Candidatus Nitrohelix vancouverensis]